MQTKTNKVFWIVLLVLGCLDLFRGFMHTAVLNHAAANIAGVTDPEAIFLLRTFGLSNYLTGALFIMIALKAKPLAPYALLAMPVSYIFGILVSPPINSTAQYNGKSMMTVYMVVCVVMGVWGIIDQRRHQPETK